ncbi:hypothetical protein [Enterobacter hormaechei]|uniref:hypothetical protein n=1 Tax=Enterobacter hormaechei TaxID=158836 RepID=UPI00175728FF|nr:hypothetical protein [Escherichia coli]HAH1938856.1 hypothetical protein [Escherichia coli]
MNKPYDTALEFVNEIIERDIEGQKLRAEGKDGICTWTAKDTGDAYRWLNGYVKALEDNALITDEQLETLRKKIVSLSGCAAPKPEREVIVKPERQGRDLDREPMTRVDFTDFLPKIDE